ncbi:tyrosine-protein phosphatase [Rhodococcoides yunnanense]|uniref:tyrosine-protein phosphatase n=1 Tax=Rhodococcoides yunnanense TaxID=278209 RepID=UPI0009355D88|nr:tyrosine-protein phosphatase [Rhodococcus yunnanensis]
MAETRIGDQFQLSGAWNFRDVGGARTDDGRVVRSGVFFRSSELSRLDDAGREEVTRLGIRRVFDLRADAEIERSGADRVPDGVTVVNIPFHNDKGERAPHETAAEAADAQSTMMSLAYTSFPTLEGAHAAIRAVITELGRGEAPLLVHCAAGKDRAGWTVATVLRAVGVRDEDVLSDFLASNAAAAPLKAHLQAVYAPLVAGPIEPSDDVLGVTEDYYRSGLDVVAQKYGSFEAYVDALGVTAGDIDTLRAALLRDAD